MENKKQKGILISIMGFFQGGAEIMPIRIANYLFENNYRVGVHCMKKEDDSKIRKLLNPDIPVYYTDSATKLAVVVIKNGYRIIHSHCVASQLIVARMKKRIPFIHIQHVATSHGGYEGLGKNEAYDVLKEADRHVNIWTYVADNNKETFRAFGIAENKMRKIGNAMIPPGEIIPVELKKFGIPEDAIVFCVITRAVWKKCWKECIEAVKMARTLTGKNIHLILGGTGPIYDELMGRQVEEFIHPVGTVENPCGFYKSSYCGLLLSVRECAPLGIIEMYYAGIPVVATNTGDIREMMQLGDGTAGIVVDLTDEGYVPVSEAAKAIAKMIQDRELYLECRNNACKKAGEFSMDNIMEKYIECYKM